MRPRNFKEAAQASLDERWYPMAEAKSCDEMNEIYGDTDCALCELQCKRHEELKSIYAPNETCGDCPLDSGDTCA